MKKFVKIVFSAIGIILLCLMIFGQIAKTAMKPMMEESKQKSEFARMIERADRDCPIPVAMGKGAVTGIKLEDEYVTYYLSYDKDFINLLSRINNDQKVKEGILMCFLCLNAQGYNQGDLVMDVLIRFGYGMKVVITASANGRSEFSATAKEIETLRERFQLNPHEALYNLLALSIESERNSLPMQLDEGLVMTDYKLEDEDIAIIIQIDENLYSIDEMRLNSDLIKASMIQEGLNQPESKSLLDMCKLSHTGLVYRMFGNFSHEKFEVKISSDEIRRLVPTPSNINIQ